MLTTEEIKNMTVTDIINAISTGNLKVKDVAKAFGKSDRTIQGYIKKLGYVWNATDSNYLATGEGYHSENNKKLFSDFVPSGTQKRKPSGLPQKERSDIKEETEPRNSIIKNSNKKIDYEKLDSIDKILLGDSINNERVQRAYYLDKDIVSIIDNIHGNQKSNLVNECLRKVFKEKGYLE